jgi:hypothetical protein
LDIAREELMIHTRVGLALLACVTCLLTATVISANAEETRTHTVKSKQLFVTLSDKGEIAAIGFGAKQAVRAVRGLTILEDCMVKEVRTSALPEG